MVPSRNLGIQPGRVAYHLPSCHCMPGRPCVFGSSLLGDARLHLLIADRPNAMHNALFTHQLRSMIDAKKDAGNKYLYIYQMS